MTRAGWLLIPVLLLSLLSCTNGQEKTSDRQPAVAGGFYPADPGQLTGELTRLFAGVDRSRSAEEVLAVIVPHAGYVYSGGVAASGYAKLDPEKTYENIFIIGPSHYVGFEGGAVFTTGNFVTPLGTVVVNRELGRQLTRKEPLFSDRTDAHDREHSVEVQIPFLQHVLKHPFTIVPIVVGSNSPAVCKRLGNALRPYFTAKNLFVISSDFSHYPSSTDAVAVDKLTADAVCSNSPETLLATLKANENKGIPNLETSLCGWSAVLTFLSMSSSERVTFSRVLYRNSGDAGIGDKQRVVGYWSIIVTTPPQHSSSLDEGDKAAILKLARETITSYLSNGTIPSTDPSSFSPSLQEAYGAFVTLNVHGNLRGCIGRFEPVDPLYKTIQSMAVAAATQDPRFVPLRAEELKNIEIEISVLTPLRRIHSIEEFQLGKHGIYMRKGDRSGTFLPQVAKETGWTKEEFLGHCAEEKAGIGWDGWKDAELYVYEAIVFGEKELKGK